MVRGAKYMDPLDSETPRLKQDNLEIEVETEEPVPSADASSVVRARLVLAAVAVLEIWTIVYCVFVHPIKLDLTLSAFQPRDSPISRDIAMGNAVDLLKKNDACRSTSICQKNFTCSESEEHWVRYTTQWLTLVYTTMAPAGNLLVPEYLNQIRAVEDKVTIRVAVYEMTSCCSWLQNPRGSVTVSRTPRLPDASHPSLYSQSSTLPPNNSGSRMILLVLRMDWPLSVEAPLIWRHGSPGYTSL